MTPEEIKKIADNSAYKAIDDWKQNKTVGLRRLISDACVDALNRLSERFYLVEKGKTKEELISALKRCRNQDYYDGAYETLQSLFGPDIRKEEDI